MFDFDGDLNNFHLIVMGEVIVGDGDGSGTHDGVYQTIGAIGQGAMIYPDVTGPKDRDSITIGNSPPTIMCR